MQRPSVTPRKLFGSSNVIRALVLAVALAGSSVPATACPLCKYANEVPQAGEEANRKPQAYMYSILFMLAMPASLLTAFSTSFYRLWKKQQAAEQAAAKEADKLAT